MRTLFRRSDIVLAALVLCLCIWMGTRGSSNFYTQHIYPLMATPLSFLSGLVPFAVGDVFVMLSIAWLVAYPVYAAIRKQKFLKTAIVMLRYLAWLYVWFYVAWGLNYKQGNFYNRTGIGRAQFSLEQFTEFAEEWADSLNATYMEMMETDRDMVHQEIVASYQDMGRPMGIHRPFYKGTHAKTMLYTPLASKVGVTGSMAPFLCEFTLNGDLQPLNYPHTYAHEYSHLLGIGKEGEANFYAYMACTRSEVQAVRYSGYFSIFYHMMGNARRLLPADEFQRFRESIRPEVMEQARQNSEYWNGKYSPLIGRVQDWIYNWYLKRNSVSGGMKNYSEVVGLIISYRHRNRELKNNSKYI